MALYFFQFCLKSQKMVRIAGQLNFKELILVFKQQHVSDLSIHHRFFFCVRAYGNSNNLVVCKNGDFCDNLMNLLTILIWLTWSHQKLKYFLWFCLMQIGQPQVKQLIIQSLLLSYIILHTRIDQCLMFQLYKKYSKLKSFLLAGSPISPHVRPSQKTELYYSTI